MASALKQLRTRLMSIALQEGEERDDCFVVFQQLMFIVMMLWTGEVHYEAGIQRSSLPA